MRSIDSYGADRAGRRRTRAKPWKPSLRPFGGEVRFSRPTPSPPEPKRLGFPMRGADRDQRDDCRDQRATGEKVQSCLERAGVVPKPGYRIGTDEAPKVAERVDAGDRGGRRGAAQKRRRQWPERGLHPVETDSRKR